MKKKEEKVIKNNFKKIIKIWAKYRGTLHTFTTNGYKKKQFFSSRKKPDKSKRQIPSHEDFTWRYVTIKEPEIVYDYELFKDEYDHQIEEIKKDQGSLNETEFISPPKVDFDTSCRRENIIISQRYFAGLANKEIIILPCSWWHDKVMKISNTNKWKVKRPAG